MNLAQDLASTLRRRALLSALIYGLLTAGLPSCPRVVLPC